ncbi:hypothetical protein QJS04_geneDACA016621 [Acorus gramineus]|uniref:Uncharacterized protein n=1 Tax=Acorus gramineus TaxID=55184 RepID=A0AAV9BNK1_ACOGR|nr:hypothetical protein QJS04_geneDACA016621 [Acorus gramineus]
MVLHKVSPLLPESESNRPSFVPKVVSIGPYHHGDPRLAAMEPYKIQASKEYGVAACKMVRGMAESVRKMYEIDPDNEMDPNKFADMLFHDACFVVHFISYYRNLPDPSRKPAAMDRPDYQSSTQGSTTTGQAASSEGFVVRDLFLLENQLPYTVLKTVVSVKNSLSFDEDLQKFIGNVSHNNDKERAKDVVTRAAGTDNAKYPDEYRIDMSGVHAEHLLDMLHQMLINPETCYGGGTPAEDGWDTLKFRSVMELTEAGIKFKPNKIGNLTDVKYKGGCLRGTVSLPRMIIDDSTKSNFLNLMALEMCPKGKRGYGVTSYICLLDNLIDHADDVRELRKRNVLVNFLGSDEQVADLFNELATDRTPHPNAYRDTITGIHNHLKNPYKVTFATTINTHFNTPWSIVATVAATAGLALSAVQAGYAVKQG